MLCFKRRSQLTALHIKNRRILVEMRRKKFNKECNKFQISSRNNS